MCRRRCSCRDRPDRDRRRCIRQTGPGTMTMTSTAERKRLLSSARGSLPCVRCGIRLEVLWLLRRLRRWRQLLRLLRLWRLLCQFPSGVRRGRNRGEEEAGTLHDDDRLVVHVPVPVLVLVVELCSCGRQGALHGRWPVHVLLGVVGVDVLVDALVAAERRSGQGGR